MAYFDFGAGGSPTPAPTTTPPPATGSGSSSTGRNKPSRRIETGHETSTGSETFDTQNVATRDPYEEFKPYLDEFLGLARSGFGEVPRTPFTGDFFAEATPQDWGTVNDLYGLSGQIGSGAGAVRDYGNDLLSGKYLDPSTNPWIAAATAAALRPVEEKYFDVLVPALEDAAIAGGAYGGARQGIEQLNLANNFTREAGDLASSIYFQNYNNERAYQQSAPEYLTLADSMELLGPQLALEAGDLSRNFQQIGLNNELQRFLETVEAPMRGFDQYANLLSLASPYGTQTTDSSGTSSYDSEGTSDRPRGGVGGALQGALGGGLAGAKIGPIGAIIGALLGGIGGGFF